MKDKAPGPTLDADKQVRPPAGCGSHQGERARLLLRLREIDELLQARLAPWTGLDETGARSNSTP